MYIKKTSLLQVINFFTRSCLKFSFCVLFSSFSAGSLDLHFNTKYIQSCNL